MSRDPFIVHLSVPVDTFRVTLAAELADARIVRELPGQQVVVLVPAGLGRALAGLPGVRSAVPDALQHKLSPGPTA